MLSEELTVVEGAQPQPIEVTVRDDAASLRGTVAPGDDMVPVTVLLVQPRGTGNLIKVGGAFQGKFEIDGVTPGDYLLLAFEVRISCNTKILKCSIPIFRRRSTSVFNRMG